MTTVFHALRTTTADIAILILMTVFRESEACGDLRSQYTCADHGDFLEWILYLMPSIFLMLIYGLVSFDNSAVKEQVTSDQVFAMLREPKYK